MTTSSVITSFMDRNAFPLWCPPQEVPKRPLFDPKLLAPYFVHLSEIQRNWWSAVIRCADLQIAKMGLRVIHVAPGYGGGTLVYRFTDPHCSLARSSVVEVATALCHPGDTFNRQVGRVVATYAFYEAHTVLLPLLGQMTPPALAWQLLSGQPRSIVEDDSPDEPGEEDFTRGLSSAVEEQLA